MKEIFKSRVVFVLFRSRRNKLKGATAMLNMFSGRGGGSTAEEDAELEEDRDRLRDFQFKMLELQVPRHTCTWAAISCIFLVSFHLERQPVRFRTRDPRLAVNRGGISTFP